MSMDVPRDTLRAVYSETVKLRRPGDRLTVFSSTQLLKGYALVGVVLDDIFFVVSIELAEYDAMALAMTLGLLDRPEQPVGAAVADGKAYQRAVVAKKRLAAAA